MLKPDMPALGMIETEGFTAAVEAIDSALKTASVALVKFEKTGNGRVTVIVRGSVGDCNAGIDAAVSSAGKIGNVLSARVIPCPHFDVELKLPIGITKEV